MLHFKLSQLVFTFLLLTFYPCVALSANRATSMEASIQALSLARGINLSADDYFKTDKSSFGEAELKQIKEAGFSTIRLNLFIFYALKDGYTIDPAYLTRLDNFLDMADRNNLYVILDEHDSKHCNGDEPNCVEKLKAVWRQLAERYKGRSSFLLFELLNEPNGKMTPYKWNQTTEDLLSIIRLNNKSRNILIGPAGANNIWLLRQLKLPSYDQHIIVTFHYYDPIEFTHQGASWRNDYVHDLKNVSFGSDAQIKKIISDFAYVKQWSEITKRPVYLGEFGSLETAAIQDRVTYTSVIARTAEREGFSWSYWQFSHDFSAYDMRSHAWIFPIVNSLIPENALKGQKNKKMRLVK